MAKKLQLLRNASLYGSHDAALSALKTKLGNVSDGEPVLARYTEGNVTHTILGIGGTGGYEIFDNAGSNEALIEAIERLDYTWEGVEKKPITSISETDGVIAPVQGSINAEFVDIADSGSVITATTVEGALQEIAAEIDGMDLSEVGGGDGDVLTTISETDGKVSASKASLSDILLTGYSKTNDTGDIEATDSVGVALSKLENQIGQNAVSSADGTVKIDSTGATTDLAVYIDNTTLVKNDGTEVAADKGKISANLEIVELNSTEIAELSDNNVKEAYKLIYKTDASRTAIGGTVKIYKDSALQEVYLGSDQDTINISTGVITKVTVADPQSMNFAYQLSDGTYSLTKIDVSKFLTDSEFADGLQVSGAGVVSVKKDSTSGQVRTAAGDAGLVDVLTVSSGGVKVDNIQAAIDYATADLAVSAQGDNYITAAVDANNNKKINVTADVQSVSASAGTRGTYTVTDAGAVSLAGEVVPSISGVADSLVDGSDVASKVKTYVDAAVAAEAAARDAYIEGAVKALDVTDTADGGKYVSAVSETDGKISVTRANVGEALITGFTTSTSTTGAIAATDSISDALNKLQNKADNGLDSVAAGNGINVSEKSSKSQTITAVAKSGDPIIEVTANGIATKENAIWDCGTYGDEPEP